MKAILLSVLLIIIVLNLGGCKKEDDASITKLDGLWIEQKDKMDTLDFSSGFFLDLRRGTENRSDHILPKYGSGLYNYQIKGDSISLLNLFLSCSTCYNNYYFVIKGAELRIGDFYKKDSLNPQSLIFLKK